MKKSNVLLILWCVAAVAFTLLFRLPSILTPHVYDHEWHTSTVTRHLQIWHEQGAFNPFFAPSVSYEKPADKHINNHSSIEVGRPGYSNSAGDYFYVSYPPLAYIAPYVAHKVLGLEPTIVGVRVFNLLTQIGTAAVLLLLLYRMTRSRVAGFVGFLLYLVLPISLYMHTANYMSDMFVQFFFVLGAYFFYTRISTGKDTSVRAYWPLALTLFLMLYTEWIGVFVCAFLFGYALLKKRSPHRVPLLVMSVCVPLCTLVIILLQYASVSNIASFLNIMFDRYTHGYVPEEIEHPMLQLDAIFQNYVAWFGPAILATTFLAALALALKKMRLSFEVRSQGGMVLLFLLVPVVLHHIVFFDWTAYEIHFFSILKTTPFFCVLIALLVHRLCMYQGGWRKVLLRTSIIIALFFLCLSSVVIYADEMKPQLQRDALEYCNLGVHFKELSADDEVVFLRSIYEEFNNIISSIIILCAERNVALYTTLEDAEALIEQNGLNKGVVYTITYVNGGIRLVRFDRLRLLQGED